MTMNRHEPFEELISASLHGDLTVDERRRLDAHLDACDQCRATLAAFAEERRMIAGLRHMAPPRDLGARVRAGIEYANVPWWRKPAAIFTAVGGTLAAVAGALLALVMLNGTDQPPEVGQLSPTPTVVATPGESEPAPPPPVATPSPITALPEPPQPGETPAPTPTPDPEATENPIAKSDPEPDLFVAMTTSADSQTLSVVGSTDEPLTVEPAEGGATGPPIVAELSPDGGWLAMVAERGLSGLNDMSVSRVADANPPADSEATPIPEPDVDIATTVELGESVAGSPFVERMAWAPDGSKLAYTIAAPDGSGTDVWIFDRAAGEARQLTATGDAYAGSWVVPATTDGEASAPLLWVSRAGDPVTSYLIASTNAEGDPLVEIDPAEVASATVQQTFQPIVSPTGSLVIYWKGVMSRSDSGEWTFSQGGAPYLAEYHPDEAAPFQNERPLFSDVAIDRDAFTSAAIAWGWDGDAYAVWNAEWTGTPQFAGDEDPYPDPRRIYFGHASDPRGLTREHAVDQDALLSDGSIVDVKVSPTGHHLVVTVRLPTLGDLSLPTARLVLVTRSLNDGADLVEPVRDADPAAEGEWFGPAVFDDLVELPPDGSSAEPAPSPGASEAP